jgi:hypothetical protein
LCILTENLLLIPASFLHQRLFIVHTFPPALYISGGGSVWFGLVSAGYGLVGGYNTFGSDRHLVLLRILCYLGNGGGTPTLAHERHGQSTYLEGLVCPRAQAPFLSSYTLVVIGGRWSSSTCTFLPMCQVDDGHAPHGTFCESVSFRFSVYRM